MSEPMSAERLDEIEQRAQLVVDVDLFMVIGGTDVAKDALELVAEIRRLQRENQLLHASRGSSALVGMD